MVHKYPGEADTKTVRSHIHKFLHTGFKQHTDLRDKLSQVCKTVDEFKQVVEEMIERRKDMSAEEKIGWYYRYWDSEGKVKGETRTWVGDDWTEQINNDPIFNKKLKDKADADKTRTEAGVKNDNILLEGGMDDMNLGSFLDDNC